MNVMPRTTSENDSPSERVSRLKELLDPDEWDEINEMIIKEKSKKATKYTKLNRRVVDRPQGVLV